MNNKDISLQEYLKKYSTINNKFIDDFFNLYDEDTTDIDFVINLDKLVMWLKTEKKHMKKTLLESYQENIDYKITTNKPNGKGRPSEEIMLTPNCFKRLCMMSRTPKAEQVRDYFLQIETHLDKYKSHIIQGLRNDVRKAVNELKPTPEISKGGVIYIFKTTEDIEGVYKIGKTQDFKNRLKTHQSSHPEKIDPIFVYETDYIDQVEKCLKDLLKEKSYRKRKEFYEIDIDILKQLIKNCDCMNMVVRKNSKNIKDKECKYILHILKNINQDKVFAPHLLYLKT
jgi:phage anti-repressor protein